MKITIQRNVDTHVVLLSTTEQGYMIITDNVPWKNDTMILLDWNLVADQIQEIYEYDG